MANAQCLLGRTAGQQCVGHGAQLVQQVLFVCQHVDAGCNRRKDIDEVARHIAHSGHDLRQGRFAQAVDLVEHGLGIIQHFNGAVQIHTVAPLDEQQHFLDAVDILRHIIKQRHNAVYDLRNDQPGQQHDQQHRHQVRQQNGYPPPAFGIFQQFGVEKPHHGV